MDILIMATMLISMVVPLIACIFIYRIVKRNEPTYKEIKRLKMHRKHLQQKEPVVTAKTQSQWIVPTAPTPNE